MVVLRILAYIAAAILAFLLVLALANVGIVLGLSKKACTGVRELSGVSPAPDFPHKEEILALPNYKRDEQITFLRFPEWYIVYSAREYASHISSKGTPSNFPYSLATAQFWCSYKAIKKHVEANYPKDSWWHVVLITIGSSFAAENLIQAAYERTVGNISLLGGGADTPQDQLEREVAAEYAKSLDVVPWYYFPFLDARARLWELPIPGEHVGRRLERQIALTIGYSVKSWYGGLMAKANGDTGDYAETELSELMTVRTPLPQKFAGDERIKIVKDFGDGVGVIEVPRYEAFTELLKEFAETDVDILDIGGNEKMLISFFAPAEWEYDLPGELFFTMPVAIDTEKNRVLAVVSNAELLAVVRDMQEKGLILEHIYDY